jgi:hypothetical protein
MELGLLLGFLLLIAVIVFFLWKVVASALWNVRYQRNKHRYVKVVATVTGSLRPPWFLRPSRSRYEAERTAAWIWVSFTFNDKQVKRRLQVTQFQADRAVRSGIVGLLVDPERPTDLVLD